VNSSSHTGLVSGTILLALLLVFGMHLVRISAQRAHAEEDQRLFLVALLLRFAASVGIYELGLVSVLLDEDASGWLGGARLYFQWTRDGYSIFDLPPLLVRAYENPLGNLGYQHMLGAVFFLTGAPARLAAAAVNCFFGAMTVVLVKRIADRLFSRWVAIRVGWWACLMPSLVAWSAQTLKEPAVIVLETIAIYSCVRLRMLRFSPRHVAACAAAILLLGAFRFYAAYVTGVVVLLTLATPFLRERRSTFASAVAIVAILVPIVLFTGVVAQHERVIDRFSLRTLQEMRDHTARNTGSGVVLDYDLETPYGFTMSALIGGAHLLLAPFPWQLEGASPRMLLTLPELVAWWWLVFMGLIPGFRYLLRHRFADIRPLLYFTASMGLLYSIIFSNVGLVYRYRAQLLPWLLIFTIVGLELRAARKLARAERASVPATPPRRPRVPVQGTFEPDVSQGAG
jgi:hypothetical protein